MQKTKAKNELFERITSTSFVLDELRLYLDTHPDCIEAITLFRQHEKVRHDLIEQYTCAFGPIEAYNVKAQQRWTWVGAPMPWRGECC